MTPHRETHRSEGATSVDTPGAVGIVFRVPTELGMKKKIRITLDLSQIWSAAVRKPPCRLVRMYRSAPQGRRLPPENFAQGSNEALDFNLGAAEIPVDCHGGLSIETARKYPVCAAPRCSADLYVARP